jgi:hypothetical protein
MDSHPRNGGQALEVCLQNIRLLQRHAGLRQLNAHTPRSFMFDKKLHDIFLSTQTESRPRPLSV